MGRDERSGRRHGVEVLQGVVVLGAHEDGDDVHVDLYGSPANICGSVRFTFEDAAQRSDMLGQLERWAGDGTPLTYVQRGTSVTLQDDTALFGDPVDSAAS